VAVVGLQQGSDYTDSDVPDRLAPRRRGWTIIERKRRSKNSSSEQRFKSLFESMAKASRL